jgi:hypothetical protein
MRPLEPYQNVNSIFFAQEGNFQHETTVRMFKKFGFNGFS